MAKKYFALFLSALLLTQSCEPAWAALTETDRQLIIERNALTNPGFESSYAGWSASGGTLTTTSTATGSGKASGAWDSSAASQTLASGYQTVTSGDGYSGQSGVVSCRFKCATGSCTHTLSAFDGTSNLVTPQTITSSTSGYVRKSVNFIYPVSGTVRAQVASVASNEPNLFVDDCFLGLAEGFNLSQISQAQSLGEVITAGGGTCNWSVTNPASYTSFPAQTACPSPTVIGTVAAPATKIPAIVVPNAGPGDYVVTATGAFEASSGVVYYQLFDGTTGRGFGPTNSSTTDRMSTLSAKFHYDTAQTNLTFQPQAVVQAGGPGNPRINNDNTNEQFVMRVEYFPSQAQTAYQATSGGLNAGEESITAATACPTGTIAEDGASYLRTFYPDLFNAIGTTYGAVDGTHFNVPDARGVFERAAGTNGTITTANGGAMSATQGTNQNDMQQGHIHSVTAAAPAFVNQGGNSYANGGNAFNAPSASFTVSSPTSDGVNGTPRTGAETRPASISHLHCIRTIAATPAPVLLGLGDRQTVIGTPTTSSGSATSSTFADISNSPTVTIVPKKTKQYKVYTTFPAESQTVNATCDYTVNNTSGSATLVYKGDNSLTQTSTLGNYYPNYIFAIYSLTAGVSYSFNTQLKCDSGPAVGVAIFARPTGGTSLIVEEFN